MPVIRHKIYAYITRGELLLVFRHIGFPEAGVQVPGGTLEPGEQPDAGVMREAFEETGLSELRLLSHLGVHEWRFSSEGRDELHQRYFYHLACEQDAPDSWQHEETHPSDGSTGLILFEFSWVPVKEAPVVLHPYYTAGLDALFQSLSSG